MKKIFVSILIGHFILNVNSQRATVTYNIEGNFTCGSSPTVCFTINCNGFPINCPLNVNPTCQELYVNWVNTNGCINVTLNNSIPQECCENGYIEFTVSPQCNVQSFVPEDCLQGFIVKVPFQCCSNGCPDECYWKLGGNDQSILVDQFNKPTNNILGTLSPFDIRMFTSGTEKAVLKTDGKLGVGTNEPTDLVDINGTLRIRNLPTKTNGDALLFATTTGSNIGQLKKLGTSATKTNKFLNENGLWEESAEWHTDGNSISGNEFIGTLNEKDFVIKVFNSEIARYRTKGNYSFGSGSIDANSYNSAIYGVNNSISNSTKSFAMGESVSMNYTNECVSFGENNTTFKSHGSFIGGAHSSISNPASFGHNDILVSYNTSLGYSNSISGITSPAGSNTNAGQFNSIIANNGGASSNGNYGTGNLIQSSNKSLNSGYSNTINNSEESFLFGALNSIASCEKTTSLGTENSITASNGSNVIGRANICLNSSVAAALGFSDTISDAGGSIILGNNNSIFTSGSSGITGFNNSVLYSNNAFLMGYFNKVDNNSNLSHAYGNYNNINSSLNSFEFGNFNRILNSRNSIVIGSNALVEAENSITIGHFSRNTINNNSANNSIKLGINQNTATITSRGVSIQIDPTNPAYVPRYNLEVEAGGNVNGSNISFQNLPQAAQFQNLFFETVVIDPISGELFRAPLCCPIMMGLEQNLKKEENGFISEEGINVLKSKIDNLESENKKLYNTLQQYNEKLAKFEILITQLCNHSSGGMKKVNQELNYSIPVLYQSIPNPTNNLALINYYLVSDKTKAEIHIYGYDGKLMKEFILPKEIGINSINVDFSNFSDGVYRYSLLIDDKIIDSKSLQVIK